ncbi:hypothetical protein G7054_g11625 [Neopestalotiopsis clavispora]|nr:hypothetical protein G7054_g11625 [Neopestalotiopsis clavispora]
MQAWVMNNGPGAKPVSAAEDRAFAHDHSGSPQKSHAVHGQPHANTQSLVAPSTPPRTQPHYQSRMPIVNANANARAAGAAAAKLPAASNRPAFVRPSHQISHSREGSNVQRHRGPTLEPAQNVQRQGQGQGPFWEGSTVEGSTSMSETASNADARMVAPSHVLHQDLAFKPRDMTRQSSKRDSDKERPPFIIGENGFINVLGGPPRRSSTPDFRSRATTKGLSQDSDNEFYVEEPRFLTDLEKTPPNTLTHRGARLPLRTTKRDTFAERTTYAADGSNLPLPPDQHRRPADALEYVQRNERNQLRVPAARESHRTTVFENIDTPVASHQDLPQPPSQPPSETESESVDDQVTPKPKVKSSQSINRQLNRQLFTEETKTNKARNSLRESSMPRPASEKRQSNTNTKKRSFDLDYDDSALANMNYSELKSQDFDFDPARAESHSAQRPPPGTLPEKLDHFFHKDTDAQKAFFNSMPMRDWDDSGDWFLEKFGDIMHRLKDARRDKRKLVDQYEAEIAEREDAVRQKMSSIDKTLGDFRSETKSMMANKQLE